MNNLNQLKIEILLDLGALLELGMNTKQAIKKVKSGIFDNDIVEFYNGGMSVTEISNYIQTA
tara:strand:- start:718 stop:903 length:186 start_codon:yes stop_codon:yes gene_type:complete